MIFVDSNVFMYAVGREHPLRSEARDFFRQHVGRAGGLATSAEVLQELLHVYLPVNRRSTLDAALALAESAVGNLWSVEADDVRLARALAERHAGLSARDLLHLACCTRREAREIMTFDRALAAVFGR